MKPTWDKIIAAINGRVVSGRPGTSFSGVSTDTRTIKEGDLFIALKGENFNGHDFVETAIKKGAQGAIVNKGMGGVTPPIQVFIIEVDDTLRALGDLARLWRKHHPVPVVAITGSNGKTTTKDMVASILSMRYRTLKTEGNLNNLIGLPQMVLRMDDSHEAAVFELGMNAFGEIRRLSEICEPDIALITNIGEGHLEGVGSIEGVAKAKEEILDGLKEGGIFVVNADDPYIKEMAKRWKGRTVRFGLESTDTNVRAVRTDHGCGHAGRASLTLSFEGGILTLEMMGFGRHNLYNATASAATATAAGCSREEIRQGLKEWRPYKGRFELFRLECGVNLIDDSYNANPSSVAAALGTLIDMKGTGRSFAVLGDMLELGGHSENAHYETGKNAAAANIDYLFLVGPISTRHTARGAMDAGLPGDRIICAEDHSDAVRRISSLLTAGDWVLVKGSRGMKMEKVVEGIKAVTREQ